MWEIQKKKDKNKIYNILNIVLISNILLVQCEQVYGNCWIIASCAEVLQVQLEAENIQYNFSLNPLSEDGYKKF